MDLERTRALIGIGNGSEGRCRDAPDGSLGPAWAARRRVGPLVWQPVEGWRASVSADLLPPVPLRPPTR
jgi:hypothetical protein